MKQLLTIVFLSVSFASRAFIFGDNDVSVNFTKPSSTLTNVTWSTPDKLSTSTNGFGWNGSSNTYQDYWIQSIPIPLGVSWRPTRLITVTSSVKPSTNHLGRLFIRYSPDKKHWSTWQSLSSPSVQVEVPGVSSAEYDTLLREYSRLDVPWASDEEAASQWILQRYPDFFEKHLPFIGYAQFRMEGLLPGNIWIESLSMHFSWGISGLSVLPRDPEAHDKRQGTWRFEAH